MNRFIDYFRRRVPLTDAAERFLRQHGRIVAYDRHNHFLTLEVRMPYWCMVFEGMAYGYTLDADSQLRIRWFAAFMQHFPELAWRVTPDQQMDFINVRHSQFFDARKRWLRRGGK